MSQAVPEEVATKPRRRLAPRKKSEPAGRNFLRDTFFYQPLTWSGVDAKVVFWMVLMHAGCIAAPFFFSWSALGVAAVLYLLTGTAGICLCYHRYLAHKSFKLARPAEAAVHTFACLALQGGPLTWAATHRIHHARSDQEGDPHSPRDGRWWSHLLWLFPKRSVSTTNQFLSRVVPDLMKDPMCVFFQKTYFLWTVALGIGLFAIGGWSWLLWGLCVRMVVTYHATWCVNSATHLWGYRNYETTDDSKNLWWVALITGGEGWHNNHHAYPRIARAGHRWWEIDTTYALIWLLKKTGLAWDVNDALPDVTRRSAKPLSA